MADKLSYPAVTRLTARALGLPVAQLEASLSPARLQDLDEVVALRRRLLGEQVAWDDRPYLTWRYGLGSSEPPPGTLWLWRHQGALEGMVGDATLHCTLQGQPQVGAHAQDLLVSPGFHGAGMGLWLNLALLQRHDFVVAMSANRNSAGIVRRLYLPLPDRVTWTLPVGLRRSAAPAALAVASRWAWGGYRRLRTHADPGLVVNPMALDAADALPEGPDGNLTMRRDAAFLRHRLQHNPRTRYQLLVAQRAGTTVGYLAATALERANGVRELHLGDWAYDRAPTLATLVVQAARLALAERCWCLRIPVQGEQDAEAVAQAGFLRPRSASRMPAGVQSRDPALAARLQAARWALTDVSSDSDGF